MSEETVTMSRAEYEALLDRIEDAEDRATVAEHNAAKTARGEAAVYADAWPSALVDRMLAGESLVRLWREHRGKTTRELASAAAVSPSYLVKIEGGQKPGSVLALSKLAGALSVSIDDLVRTPTS